MLVEFLIKGEVMVGPAAEIVEVDGFILETSSEPNDALPHERKNAMSVGPSPQSRYIRAQRPQTIAVILSSTSPSPAGKVRSKRPTNSSHYSLKNLEQVDLNSLSKKDIKEFIKTKINALKQALTRDPNETKLIIIKILRERLQNDSLSMSDLHKILLAIKRIDVRRSLRGTYFLNEVQKILNLNMMLSVTENIESHYDKNLDKLATDFLSNLKKWSFGEIENKLKDPILVKAIVHRKAYSLQHFIPKYKNELYSLASECLKENNDDVSKKYLAFALWVCEKTKPTENGFRRTILNEEYIRKLLELGLLTLEHNASAPTPSSSHHPSL